MFYDLHTRALSQGIGLYDCGAGMFEIFGTDWQAGNLGQEPTPQSIGEISSSLEKPYFRP